MKQIIILLALLTIYLPAFGKNKYYDQLIAKGFPHEYAVKLAILKQKHPNWKFEVLNVSKLEKKYTWQYVLHQETDASPSRSLISGNKIFSVYFHPTDTKSYDAACRRASVQAVAYFLDPRNFLNERDIFQFENLDAPDNIDFHDSVKSALSGSFMANATLENGKTYTEYFCELGKKFDINPIFLASRAKQEQGLTGTALVSGRCGSIILEHYQKKDPKNPNIHVTFLNRKYYKQDLLKFDGLYNFFNINATANNQFLIYLSGMIEAASGTPAMTAEWGSPKWDKKWKSIFGGAFKIANKYVKNHQNTTYLQKWNVDPRSLADNGTSRNFWGQYMQNIGAAFSESANTYRARKKHNLLEMPYLFQIPVYQGMPPKPSPDPAKGQCVFYRTFDCPVPAANAPQQTVKKTETKSPVPKAPAKKPAAKSAAPAIQVQKQPAQAAPAKSPVKKTEVKKTQPQLPAKKPQPPKASPQIPAVKKAAPPQKSNMTNTVKKPTVKH